MSASTQTAKTVESLAGILNSFPIDQIMTVISAFPTPNNYNLHMGHLRGLLYQDGFEKFFQVLGYKTLFPIGLHPTGIDTHGLAKAVLEDLIELKFRNVGDESLRSKKYGFDKSTLKAMNGSSNLFEKYVLEANTPFLELIKSGISLSEILTWDKENNEGKYNNHIIDIVQKFAVPVIQFLGEGYIQSLSRFNIDVSEFRSHFFTTIDPAYQAYTLWAMQRLKEKGFITYEGHETNMCFGGDRPHPVSITDDKTEHGVDPKGNLICKSHKTILTTQSMSAWGINYGQNGLIEETQKKLVELYKSGKLTTNPLTLDDIWQIFIGVASNSQLAHKPFERDPSMNLGSTSVVNENMKIEPLADSNIYFEFYGLVPHILKGKIKQNQLTTNFFDFIYLSQKELSKKGLNAKNVNNGLSEDYLIKLREEMHKTYPIIRNIMGYEHLKVHFPLSTLFHVMIGMEDFLPQGVLVYGLVTKDKAKMSKSLGNMVTLDDALNHATEKAKQFTGHLSLENQKFASDGIRLYMMTEVAPELELDWNFNILDGKISVLSSLYSSFLKQIAYLKKSEYSPTSKKDVIDNWFESRLAFNIDKLSSDIFNHRFTNAALTLLYSGGMEKDLGDYIEFKTKSGSKLNKKLIESYISTYIAFARIFVPYVAEEMAHATWFSHNGADSMKVQKNLKQNLDLEKKVGLYGYGVFSGNYTISSEGLEKLYGQLITTVALEANKFSKGGERKIQTITILVPDEDTKEVLESNMGQLGNYLRARQKMCKGMIAIDGEKRFSDLKISYSVGIEYRVAIF